MIKQQEVADAILTLRKDSDKTFQRNLKEENNPDPFRMEIKDQ